MKGWEPRLFGVTVFVCLLALTSPCVRAQERVTRSVHNADLWVQTSAEYRALCLQSYELAALELQRRRGTFLEREGRLLHKQLEAHSDDRLRIVEKPVAVVMDLDETVLDNSGYQVYLRKAGRSYDNDSWLAWTRFQAVTPAAQRAVPGAVEFVHRAEEMGYQVVYISNRYEDSWDDTRTVLMALGLDVEHLDQRMMLRPDKEEEAVRARRFLERLQIAVDSPQAQAFLREEGHKEVRRTAASEHWYVTAYFGDALSDFFGPVLSGEPPERIRIRQAVVDTNRSRWGRNWFILPNPTYGYWGPGGALPASDPDSMLDDYGFAKFMKTQRP